MLGEEQRNYLKIAMVLLERHVETVVDDDVDVVSMICHYWQDRLTFVAKMQR